MAKFRAIRFNYIKMLTHSVILVLRNVEDVNISRTRCVFLHQGCHIFRHRNVRNYDCFCRTTFNVASRHPLSSLPPHVTVCVHVRSFHIFPQQLSLQCFSPHILLFYDRRKQEYGVRRGGDTTRSGVGG